MSMSSSNVQKAWLKCFWAHYAPDALIVTLIFSVLASLCRAHVEFDTSDSTRTRKSVPSQKCTPHGHQYISSLSALTRLAPRTERKLDSAQELPAMEEAASQIQRELPLSQGPWLFGPSIRL